MVRFTSSKYQNVPLRSLYHPAACWRLNGQRSSQLRENAESIFSCSVTLLHMMWFTSSTDYSVTIPGERGRACVLAVFAVQIFLVNMVTDTDTYRRSTCRRYRRHVERIGHSRRPIVSYTSAVWLFLSFSSRVNTCILLKAMFRAASFGGQFAFWYSPPFIFSVFRYYLLIYLANKICSVLYRCLLTISDTYTIAVSQKHFTIFVFAITLSNMNRFI